MSLDWDARACGFNVLHATIVVAYSPLGAFGAEVASHAVGTAGPSPTRQPVAEASNYVPPREWQPSLATAMGKESSLSEAEAIVDALRPTINMLSCRQLDVLRLIVQGRSNKEIARALSLAEGTVKIHVAALFIKLGVRRRAAVAVAGARILSEAPQITTPPRRASSSRPRLGPLQRRSIGSEITPSRDQKPGEPHYYSSAWNDNWRPNVGSFRRS
jgi:DNA-binding CsgD family transcriptional regulator